MVEVLPQIGANIKVTFTKTNLLKDQHFIMMSAHLSGERGRVQVYFTHLHNFFRSSAKL